MHCKPYSFTYSPGTQRRPMGAKRPAHQDLHTKTPRTRNCTPETKRVPTDPGKPRDNQHLLENRTKSLPLNQLWSQCTFQYHVCKKTSGFPVFLLIDHCTSRYVQHWQWSRSLEICKNPRVLQHFSYMDWHTTWKNEVRYQTSPKGGGRCPLTKSAFSRKRREVTENVSSSGKVWMTSEPKVSRCRAARTS